MFVRAVTGTSPLTIRTVANLVHATRLVLSIIRAVMLLLESVFVRDTLSDVIATSVSRNILACPIEGMVASPVIATLVAPMTISAM